MTVCRIGLRVLGFRADLNIRRITAGSRIPGTGRV
jgi:hypothetical protein